MTESKISRELLTDRILVLLNHMNGNRHGLVAAAAIETAVGFDSPT
jgi:hypothetical protein